MLKKSSLLFTAALLLAVSCKPESGPYSSSYPPITYANDSEAFTITVTNAAKEKITLDPEESKTLNSDVRGRASIIEIQPAYVRIRSKSAAYNDIHFEDREQFELNIENYALEDIILTERNGYLLPLSVKVTAAAEALIPGSPPVPSTRTAYVYTNTPSFALQNGQWPIKSKKSGDTLLVVINPPDGWK